MISIGRNIAALGATRSLDRATDTVARTSERLASGLRINRASDDAAGIAVADTLKARAKLFDVAGRNINDGISAINIASSAIDAQITIVQRLAELAEQSATGTYGATQRESADKEYQALIAEYVRIGESTTFNDVNLLRAGRGANPTGLQIQTGVTGQAASSLTVQGANSASLSGTIYANRIFAKGIAAAPGAQYSLDELAALTQGQYYSTSLVDSSGETRDVFLTLEYFGSSDYNLSAFVRNSDVGPDGYGEDSFTIAGQSNFLFYTSASITNSSATLNLAFDSGNTNAKMSVDLSGLTLGVGTALPSSGVIAGDISRSTAIEFSNVATAIGARSALTLTNARLAELSAIQGQFGAAQSRLASSLRGTESSRINNLAAESRIRDVDVAEETARRALAQIRQQTSAQVLSQAVQQPSIALALLRN